MGSQGCRSAAGVANHSGEAEFLAEPGKRGGPFQAPARGDDLASLAIAGALLAHQLGGEVQHQAGFRQARVQPVGALRLGDELGDPLGTTP